MRLTGRVFTFRRERKGSDVLPTFAVCHGMHRGVCTIHISYIIRPSIIPSQNVFCTISVSCTALVQWRERIRGGLTAGPPAWQSRPYGVRDDALYKLTFFTFYLFTFVAPETSFAGTACFDVCHSVRLHSC